MIKEPGTFNAPGWLGKWSALLFGMGLNILDGLIHGLDFLRLIVRNFDIKLFFKSHDEFHRIQGVRP